jgi:integrase
MASIQKHIGREGKQMYKIQWKDYSGKRKTKVFNLPLSQVKNIAKKLDVEAEEIRNGFRPRPSDSISIDVCTERFLKSSKIDKKSPQTIIRYEKVFKPFKEYFGDDCSMKSINPAAIEEYKAERCVDVKTISVNTELRHLKALFAWATRLEYIPKSPFKGVKMLKEEDVKVRFLSRKEVKKLFKTIKKEKNHRAFDLVTFYLQTGARASEILEEGGFTWESIKEDHIEIVGKGGKLRKISINDKMRSILNSRRKERVPFPYTYSAVSQSLSRKLFHRAGIPDANLHTLRKTAGARLIQKGSDIYHVSKFLGHSSVTVTEKYYVDILDTDYRRMSELLNSSTPKQTKVSEPSRIDLYKVA